MASYDTLNPRQREAVLCTEGPLLVLAGAGSGKTRVLTHRIACLIDEKGVDPWNILAITFTNKAAAEMRERVDRLVENGADRVWVSTFHSLCVRILRRFIDRIGGENNFAIYDTDDQRTLMKQILKRLQYDPKQFRERAVLSVISGAKNELISPQEFMENAQGDWRERKIALLYQEYQTSLKKNNALDFDDLIFRTVDLFREDRQVLEHYQERFRYLMVDEYQDTNRAQFELISLLARKYKNLCVVGDDDQSIYRFRGADIRNILEFEQMFPGTKTVRLEQNYRSTKAILEAANAVIRNNRGRKKKTLWTANGEGEQVEFHQYDQAWEEAEGIVLGIIKDMAKSGRSSRDYAVLYRTNAQSRLLEEQCISHNLPYRLVGGVNFYQRKEIRDVLSYLKTIANGLDDLAVQRIINVPKRGIGTASVDRMMLWAQANDANLYDACLHAGEIPGLSRAAAKIRRFTDQIEDLREQLHGGLSIHELIDRIVTETGYREELLAEGETEAQTRLENIDELVNKAAAYEKEQEAPDLDEFLEEVALVADVDSLDGPEERVTLMTLHSAKGLEFPVVYLAGLEEGLFPSSMSVNSDDREALEEERRLCYVGITRARERLIMSGARRRMVNGEVHYAAVSRFVKEIPEEQLKTERPEPFLSRPKDADLPWNQGDLAFGTRYEKKTSRTTTQNYGKNPGFGKAFNVQKQARLDYQVGDRVRSLRNPNFGEGVVQNIEDEPRDYKVTVLFDTAGVRKLYASFAQLEKV